MGTALSYVQDGDDEAVEEQPFDPATVYALPKVEIPLDEADSRYVRSFPVDQTTEIAKFFDEYGFVVVRDVLTAEQCHASVDEIWTFLETRGYKLNQWYGSTEHEKQRDEENPPALIKRGDAATWDNDWPAMSHVGILGYLPVFTKQALENRQNLNVYSVFAAILNRKDLMVSHDRFGLFRPTRAKSNPESVNQEWKTVYSVHWDMNPWRHSLDDPIFVKNSVRMQETIEQLNYEHPADFCMENNASGSEKDGVVSVQGLINFADNLAEDGGFQIVVGCHRHVAKWAESCKDSWGVRMRNRCMVMVHSDDPLYKQAQRVSMRAGSLVVWDQRMAHGSAPNNSCNLRMSQFIKMSPALDSTTSQAQNRMKVIREKVAKAAGFELSDVGKRIFGLQEW